MSFIKVYAVWIAAAALFAALAGAYFWVHHDGKVEGRAEVQATFDVYKAEQSAKYAKLVSDTAAQSSKLQGDVDAQRTMDAAAIAMANTRYDALAVSLRNRPNRPTNPASLPTGTGAGAGGCTGAGLARSDGEFLAWYSISAYRLQAALNSCQAQYVKVKHAVNGD